MNNQGLEALADIAAASPKSTEDLRSNLVIQAPGQKMNSASPARPGNDNNTQGLSMMNQGQGLESFDVSALQNLQARLPQQIPPQLQSLLQLAVSTGNSNGNTNPAMPAAHIIQALLTNAQSQQQQQQQQQAQQQVQQAQLEPNSLLNSMQNMGYLQLLMQSQLANAVSQGQQLDRSHQQHASTTTTPPTNPDRNQHIAMTLMQQLQSSLQDQTGNNNIRQVLPSARVINDGDSLGSNNSSLTSMPPPPTAPSSTATTGVNVYGQPTQKMVTNNVAPTLPKLQTQQQQHQQQHISAAVLSPSVQAASSHDDCYYEVDEEGKKLLKRAANRKSAQLSRKRKKQFIEELKEENDELRRKELILRSIPDLIVVFDSSGKLCFVSQSVSRFMNFTANDLLGTSFWERICDDSVRLLKAAFMDSLAARQSDSDTAPLGSGVWELRLVDKDGSTQLVTLNGVVHFAGEKPECICSIRPRDASSRVKQDLSSSAFNDDSALNENKKELRRSEVSNSGSESSGKALKKPKHMIEARERKNRLSTRISDSCNSSGESESGSNSSDETNDAA